MTRHRLVPVVAIAVLAAGCGPKPTTQAGGKPVSHWVAALDDPDPHVRKEAADKLGNVGTADAAARPAVLRALRDRDARVRRAAVLAIAKFGPPADEAESMLRSLKADDPDPLVRSYAARALELATGRKDK